MGPALRREDAMAKVLVAYGTKMGGTQGIAERIAETLRSRGHEVTLAAAGGAPREGQFAGAGGGGRRCACSSVWPVRGWRRECGSSTAGHWATSTPTIRKPYPRRCRP